MKPPRRFALFPAAVAVVMIDTSERILLLESDQHTQSRRPRADHEVPSGAIEDAETILDAVAREIREELGTDVRWEPVGVVHAYTISYEGRPLISVVYLVAYTGGEVRPGDDAAGSIARWMTLEEIDLNRVGVPDEPWILEHAVKLHRLMSSG